MQLSSMTGFTRAQGSFSYQNKTYAWVWEIKSVNAKGLDVKTRIPQWLSGLDEEVKKLCASYFARGTVNISLDITSDGAEPEVTVNAELLAKISAKVSEIYLVQPELFAKPNPADLLNISGVVTVKENTPDEEEVAALKAALLASFKTSAEALAQDRQNEGAKIYDALQNILAQIKRTTDQAAAIYAGVNDKIKAKIATQINELAADVNVSEERLGQEALLLIMKADVKEELDRLYAHIKTAGELLAESNPVGRRLDFLCQELNRESNTLCSKSMDIAQTQCGMELKALIEQFREQIQNVE